MTATEALRWLCAERSLDLAVVIGPSRKREHVRLRWWLAGELSSAGYNDCEIGNAMNRDHSSIWHGLHGGRQKRTIVLPEMPDVFCSCCIRQRRRTNNWRTTMNRSLKVRSALKAGGITVQHNRRTMKVTSGLKAGGFWPNHSHRLLVVK